MRRTQYRAGIVTLHMTPAQASSWNNGGIDATGPDGDSILVEWALTTEHGLPSSKLVSLRQACLLADILAVIGNGGWLSDSLESPAHQEPTA